MQFLFEFYVKLNSRFSRIRAPNYATVRYDSTFNENINLEYRLQKIADGQYFLRYLFTQNVMLMTL